MAQLEFDILDARLLEEKKCPMRFIALMLLVMTLVGNNLANLDINCQELSGIL